MSLLLAPAEGEQGEAVDRPCRPADPQPPCGRRYDVVVVDCGTQLDAANAAASRRPTTRLLVTTPDVVAVRAAKRMVRMWERLQIRKAEETLTLVNRTSRHSEIQPALVARIVGTPLARATVPANFKELQTAVDAGRMQDLDGKGAVRQALWRFAGELGLTAASESATGGGRHSRTGKGAKAPARPGKQVTGGASPGAALPPGRTAGDASARSGGTRGGGGPAGGFGPPGAAQAPGSGTYPRGPVSRQALPPGAPPPAPPGGPGALGAPGGPNGAAAPGGAHGPGPVPPPTRARRGTGGAAAEDDDADDSVWGDRGAVTVEFAGIAPIALVVLVLLWQCVLIGYTFSLAGDVADEAARAATAAAADGDPHGACQAAATEHLPAKWRDDATVSCRLTGHLWTADVDLGTPVLFPGAGSLPFTVSGRAGAAEEG